MKNSFLLLIFFLLYKSTFTQTNTAANNGDFLVIKYNKKTDSILKIPILNDSIKNINAPAQIYFYNNQLWLFHNGKNSILNTEINNSNSLVIDNFYVDTLNDQSISGKKIFKHGIETASSIINTTLNQTTENYFTENYISALKISSNSNETGAGITFGYPANGFNANTWSLGRRINNQFKLSDFSSGFERAVLTIDNSYNIVFDSSNTINFNSRVINLNSISYFYKSFRSVESNNGSFISLEPKTIQMWDSINGSQLPLTSTPTSWANGKNIPSFRIRHPLNTSGVLGLPENIQKDFLIVPYQYGMAIEYNGIVECWVGEWSIHKGISYYDVEGKNNGWGGVFWVGDDLDEGGVRLTSRNNISLGGNQHYGEISVEQFSGLPNGDMRFRLPSSNNNFQFAYGNRGSDELISFIGKEGLKVPSINKIINTNGKSGQLLFEDSSKLLKVYDGNEWKDISYNKIITGSFTTSSSGGEFEYYISHSLNFIPKFYMVNATSADAANIKYITADANHIIIHYENPPNAGTNNLSWNWQIQKEN